jgi:hypothetical protein
MRFADPFTTTQEDTRKVKRQTTAQTVEVRADGEGLVSHAGAFLLTELADRIGLTEALSEALAPSRERRSAHDPGVVLRDLAVAVADCGGCLSDLGVLRGQESLFGRVASESTAHRVIKSIDESLLEAIRAARAKAREHAWEAGARPQTITLDIDALLLAAHSEKESPERASQRSGRCSPGDMEPHEPEPVEPPAAAPTFHEFATEWLAVRSPELRPRTVDDYTWALSYHLLPFLKDYRLGAYPVGSGCYLVVVGDLAVGRGVVQGTESKQCLEGCHRSAAAIVAEDVLVEVDVEVLLGDAAMGAVHPGLEVGDRSMGARQVARPARRSPGVGVGGHSRAWPGRDRTATRRCRRSRPSRWW